MIKLSVRFVGWGQDWPLGTLADNGRDLLFEFSESALAKGIEFSPLRLRLRPGAYGGFPTHQDRLPGLLADALPDGWGRVVMDRLFRKAGRDPARLSPLDRLAFIGDRAIGAFVFEPPAEVDLAIADLQLLALAQEARSVIAGNDSAALRELALLGGSPQGARPKVLVQYDAPTNALSTDPRGAGVPWLIKFQAADEHKDACAVEELYARLARDCGVEVPSTRYFDLDAKLAAFGVQRFDRERGLRVPVHTLAGALDADIRTPSIDYAEFLRAVRAITADEREVRKGFERATLNVLLNNRDDHARNLSFRMSPQMRWQLAPAYDLTYSTGLGGEHQMSVLGEGREPGRGHLLALARDAGLDSRWASAALDRMVEATGHLEQQAAELPIRRKTLRVVVAAVACNRTRVG